MARRSWVIMLLVTVLTACGGGSSGDGSPSPISAQPTKLVFDVDDDMSPTTAPKSVTVQFSGADATAEIISGPGGAPWLGLVRDASASNSSIATFRLSVDRTPVEGGIYNAVVRFSTIRPPTESGQTEQRFQVDVPITFRYNTFGVSREAFSFATVHGDTKPPEGESSFWIEGTQLNWQASANRPWLTLDQTRGDTPASLGFAIRPDRLAPGRNEAQVTVRNATTGGEKRVTIVVEARPPQLVTTPAKLDFAFDVLSESAALVQELAVSDEVGGGSADSAPRWTLSIDQPWLLADALSGVTSRPQKLNLSVDRTRAAALPEGRHVATASFRYSSPVGNEGVVTVPVILERRARAQADVVIYRATPAGITAAISAARLGKKVALLESGTHVGGMMTSGLGLTDFYDIRALGGLVKTFFAAVDADYGNVSADNSGKWFEPHVAERVFLKMLSGQPNVKLVFNSALSSVEKEGRTLVSLNDTAGNRFSGALYIDASYEGDLLAAAGISHALGRESSSQYDESMAGAGFPQPLGGLEVDPYRIPGSPSSGLLALIESDPAAPKGSGDDRLMAYNYRLCLCSDPRNQLPFSVPASYDPQEYELLGRYAAALTAYGQPYGVEAFLKLSALPNNKFDLNANGPVSTDHVGANKGYVTGTQEVRQQIIADHKRYMEGLFRFLSTDSRIPSAVRARVASLGLCKDEFKDNGGWSRQMYVREARRMVGEYVMTQADALRETDITDPIAMGGYPFDNHIVRRFVFREKVYDEGGFLARGKMSPYPISYRALTPKATEAGNLLVPVGLSTSHVAYTSLRVEPTFMLLGQAAGTAAAMAINQAVPVQQLDYPALAQQLVSDGQVLQVPP